MLKLRVIPTLLYKDYGLVKGVGFDSWRRTGSALQAIKVYNLREVDEIVFFDITASKEGREPDYELIDELADECFMPMSVGGGISRLEHIQKLLNVGADKVIINTAAIERPQFIREAADKFGSQCVVVAVDVKIKNDQFVVCSYSGSREITTPLKSWLLEIEAMGAGEILVTSIDKDGTMAGYDKTLIQQVVDTISLPIIASGGAGNYDDLVMAASLGVSAVAAASIFHFTESTPLEAKKALQLAGFPVRL